MSRLPAGGRIDRARTLNFSFDGRDLRGFAGDTLASALLANGVRVVGRSSKFHRPRGILSAGPEEPNALVEIDRGGGRRDPNTRATTQPLFAGLVASSQNRFPSLRFDAAALAGLAAPLLPAGFYYKTFLSPRAWQHVWEPALRRLAGLGRAPDAPDPDRYASRFAHTDVLVVGAGPAGIAAAITAAETGARVILCDEQAEPGGSLLADPQQVIEGKPAWTWLADAIATLRAAPRVRLLTATTAFHYGVQNFLALAEILPEGSCVRERLWQVRAKRVVLATGAIERPLLFHGNDRPDVMFASAARTWLNRYAVRPGRRAVLTASHDSGWTAAFELQDAGAVIVAIVDLRADPPPQLVEEAERRGIEVLAGHGLSAGPDFLLAMPRDASGRLVRNRTRTLPCDLVLMAGGWTPSVNLFSQSRGRLRWDEAADAFLPGEPAQHVDCAGACRGSDDLAACIAEGQAAGAGHAVPPPVRTSSSLALRDAVRGADASSIVDPQNDVRSGDIRLAVREGFRSIEHIKRYTTTGMATDQGKIANMVGLAVAADALDRDIPDLGFTSFRAPSTPVSFGSLAGRQRGPLFDPVRRAPLHDWAAAQGAVFEPVGLWQRARFFPRAGETMHAAVARECRAVRTAAGIFDASTLGKIEVVGPDAATFLERIYVNSLQKLPPGRCRYGLLLREDGFVFDDGIIGRLAADRFHVTTTTGGAARVLHLMEEYLQTEWPDLRVWLTSTTEHWGVIAVQGPRTADLIAPLLEGLSLAALPHMGMASCTVAGVAARLFRVSFTGERGYEINVPAGHAPAVWQALLREGAAFGLTPYGTEAMHVLRAEKGYIIVGQETDGSVTPDDVGLSRMIGKSKPDFIGKYALQRPDMRRPGRKQLVGLLPIDATVPEEGAQLIASPGSTAGLGHVTSAYASAALGRPIALGLLQSGRARVGTSVFALGCTGAPVPLRVRAPGVLRSAGRTSAWLTPWSKPCPPARGSRCAPPPSRRPACQAASAWRCRPRC